MPVSLFNGWRTASAADGRKYYFHSETKETRWTLPPAVAEVAASPASAHSSPAAELPAGWREAKAKDGRPYFFHTGTGETQWNRPIGGSAAERSLWRQCASSTNLLLDDGPYVPLPRQDASNDDQMLFTEGELVETMYRPGSHWQRARVVRADSRGGGGVQTAAITVAFDGWGDAVVVPLSRVRKVVTADDGDGVSNGGMCNGSATRGAVGSVGSVGSGFGCGWESSRGSGGAGAKVSSGGSDGRWAHDMFDPSSSSVRKGAPAVERRGRAARAGEMGELDMCKAVLHGTLRKRERPSEDEEERHVRGGALPQSNKGHDLLRKMGWTPGEGLGIEGEGGTTPVSVFFEPQRGRRGLGS